MRPWLAVALVLAAAGCNAQAASRGATGDIRIDAMPVALDPTHPAIERLGDFTYAGGLELHSRDTGRLGGLSDLRIDADGRLTAQSDEGDLVTAHLVLDDRRRIKALDHASITQLKGMDGQPLPSKAEADSEGLVIWPNGEVMSSFERDHRIWKYPKDGGPPQSEPIPPIAMPENEGMEGLALAPSHGPDAYWVGVEGGSIWLCRLGAGCDREASEIRPPFGYRLTSLSETPTGELVVLHHFWNPINKTSHVIVWITRPRPGGRAAILGKLTLAPPKTVDNFEGVETAGLPGGGVRLFLISDDNFSPDQRTLLLAFDWTPRFRGRR